MGVILQQSIKGTIVTYLGTFLGFLTTFFVLTRFLSPAEVGLSRVLIDTATLLISLAQLGASTSIIRFFPYFKDEETQHHGFFGYTVIIPFVGFLFFGLIFILVKGPVSSMFVDNSPLFVNFYYFVLPLAFAMLYQIIFETNINALMHVVFPRFVREVLVRLCMLTTYLLYAFDQISLTGFVVAICVTYGIAAIANITYLLRLGKFSWKPDLSYLTPDLKRNFYYYTLFMLTSALSGILAPMLSSYFVTAQLGLKSTGIFAIATYMASMIAMPYRSLGAIATPQIAQAVKDHDDEQVSMLTQKVALNQMFVGIFVFLAIWVNVDLIYALLPNGELYGTGRYALFFLLWGQLITSALMISNNVLNYSHHYYLSLFFTILLTAATIGLNAIMLPPWGMAGSAAASTLAFLLFYGLQLWVIHKVLHVNILTKNTLYLVVVLLFVLACDWLFNKMVMPKSPDLVILFLLAIVKNIMLIALPAYYCYKKELSADINYLIGQILLKIDEILHRNKIDNHRNR